MTEIDESEKALIEAQLKTDRLEAKEWRVGEEGTEAVVGKAWSVIEDDEERGLFAGDEGPLTACVVGASVYGNQRVMYGFTPEGTDSSEEVRPFQDVDPVD